MPVRSRPPPGFGLCAPTRSGGGSSGHCGETLFDFRGLATPECGGDPRDPRGLGAETSAKRHGGLSRQAAAPRSQPSPGAPAPCQESSARLGPASHASSGGPAATGGDVTTGLSLGHAAPSTGALPRPRSSGSAGDGAGPSRRPPTLEVPPPLRPPSAEILRELAPRTPAPERRLARAPPPAESVSLARAQDAWTTSDVEEAPAAPAGPAPRPRKEGGGEGTEEAAPRGRTDPIVCTCAPRGSGQRQAELTDGSTSRVSGLRRGIPVWARVPLGSKGSFLRPRPPPLLSPAVVSTVTLVPLYPLKGGSVKTGLQAPEPPDGDPVGLNLYRE